MPTPITKNEMVEVGIVIKTHGIDGTVVVSFNNGVLPISFNKALFANIEGMYIPLMPHRIEQISDIDFFYQFHFIDSIEKAKQIVKKLLFLPYRDCNIVEPYAIGQYLEGYELFDEKQTSLGFIRSVILSKQPLFEIQTNEGKTVYFPAISSFILKNDRLQRKLIMQIPKEWDQLYEE